MEGYFSTHPLVVDLTFAIRVLLFVGLPRLPGSRSLTPAAIGSSPKKAVGSALRSRADRVLDEKFDTKIGLFVTLPRFEVGKRVPGSIPMRVSPVRGI